MCVEQNADAKKKTERKKKKNEEEKRQKKKRKIGKKAKVCVEQYRMQSTLSNNCLCERPIMGCNTTMQYHMCIRLMAKIDVNFL